MRCGIAFGSNLGERLALLQQARAAVHLLHHGAGEPLASALYETEPVDCGPEAGAYLNGVIEIEHPGPPEQLLAALQQIEQRFGRPATRPRNAPRLLDLDLLYAGDLVLALPELVLPHPRLHLRRFVLQPLADICPDLLLPGQSRPVGELLAALPSELAVRLFTREWPPLFS